MLRPSSHRNHGRLVSEEEKMIVNGYEWEGRKVLVTGIGGFKGSWLSAYLLRLGAAVYGTGGSQSNPLSVYNLLDLDKRVVRADLDICKRQAVSDLLNSIQPEVIFHLAAKALVPAGLRDPLRTFDVNVMGTLNLVESCRELKVCERFVVVSTDHVFGNFPLEEFPSHGFVET